MKKIIDFLWKFEFPLLLCGIIPSAFILYLFRVFFDNEVFIVTLQLLLLYLQAICCITHFTLNNIKLFGKKGKVGFALLILTVMSIAPVVHFIRKDVEKQVILHHDDSNNSVVMGDSWHKTDYGYIQIKRTIGDSSFYLTKEQVDSYPTNKKTP